MLFQPHALQLVHGGQVPSSWGIYLTIAGLQEQHPWVGGCSKQFQAFVWELYP